MCFCTLCAPGLGIALSSTMGAALNVSFRANPVALQTVFCAMSNECEVVRACSEWFALCLGVLGPPSRRDEDKGKGEQRSTATATATTASSSAFLGVVSPASTCTSFASPPDLPVRLKHNAKPAARNVSSCLTPPGVSSTSTEREQHHQQRQLLVSHPRRVSRDTVLALGALVLARRVSRVQGPCLPLEVRSGIGMGSDDKEALDLVAGGIGEARRAFATYQKVGIESGKGEDSAVADGGSKDGVDREDDVSRAHGQQEGCMLTGEEVVLRRLLDAADLQQRGNSENSEVRASSGGLRGGARGGSVLKPSAPSSKRTLLELLTANHDSQLHGIDRGVGDASSCAPGKKVVSPVASASRSSTMASTATRSTYWDRSVGGGDERATISTYIGQGRRLFGPLLWNRWMGNKTSTTTPPLSPIVSTPQGYDWRSDRYNNSSSEDMDNYLCYSSSSSSNSCGGRRERSGEDYPNNSDGSDLYYSCSSSKSRGYRNSSSSSRSSSSDGQPAEEAPATSSSTGRKDEGALRGERVAGVSGLTQEGDTTGVTLDKGSTRRDNSSLSPEISAGLGVEHDETTASDANNGRYQHTAKEDPIQSPHFHVSTRVVEGRGDPWTLPLQPSPPAAAIASTQACNSAGRAFPSADDVGEEPQKSEIPAKKNGARKRDIDTATGATSTVAGSVNTNIATFTTPLSPSGKRQKLGAGEESEQAQFSSPSASSYHPQPPPPPPRPSSTSTNPKLYSLEEERLARRSILKDMLREALMRDNCPCSFCKPCLVRTSHGTSMTPASLASQSVDSVNVTPSSTASARSPLGQTSLLNAGEGQGGSGATARAVVPIEDAVISSSVAGDVVAGTNSVATKTERPVAQDATDRFCPLLEVSIAHPSVSPAAVLQRQEATARTGSNSMEMPLVPAEEHTLKRNVFDSGGDGGSAIHVDAGISVCDSDGGVGGLFSVEKTGPTLTTPKTRLAGRNGVGCVSAGAISISTGVGSVRNSVGSVGGGYSLAKSRRRAPTH